MRWLRYIFSFIWITTFLLLLLLGTAWFALQFSSVQTFAVKKATDYITEKLHNPTSIGRVNIKWFDALSLENVLIKDLQGRPMIQVARLDLDHDFWGIITGKVSLDKPLHLDNVTLYKPNVWFVYNPNGSLNLDDFIANIGVLATSSTPSITVILSMKKGIFWSGFEGVEEVARTPILAIKSSKFKLPLGL